MKHLDKLLVVLIFSSCTNKDLIIETGELNNGTYLNNSLGISISYQEDLISPWTKDSLNRATSFDRVKKSYVDFNNQIVALLIGFHDNYKNTDITLTVLNNDKVKLSKVKDYIVSKNRERVETRGAKLKITSSKKETLKIKGIDYKYFSATYMILGQDFTQKSKYAYKQHRDFILLIELPLTFSSSSSSERSPDKKELIKFLNSISFIKLN